MDEVRQNPENIDSLLDVIGGVARSRDIDNPEKLLASLLEAWKPDEEGAIALGELSDTGFSAADPVLTEARPLRRPPRLSWIASHLVPFFAGPLVALAIWGISKQSAVVLPDGLKVDAGVALGALALLVASHVVSAQLAAERLPGSLARFSSQPRGVVSGYSAGFVMVAASLASLRGPNNPIWLQIATVEFAVFALSLVATLIALVRRTDAATAAVGFGRDQRLRFQASGERMGKIQRASKRAEKELESLPWARYGGSDPLSQRREPLQASSEGFSEIRVDRLRALDRRAAWKTRSLILHVGGGLGTLVHRDQELASIVPAREAELEPLERDRAAAVFRVRSEVAIEESAEGLSALTKLAADLAAQGNPGGANRASDALIGLLGEHLNACQAVRESSNETEREEIYPVNLALQMVLTSAVRGIGHRPTGLERRTLATIAARALAVSRSGDGGVAIAVTALPNPSERAPNSEELDVLWAAAARAVQIGGRGETSHVNSRLEKWIEHQGSDTARLTEVAARITMLHLWIDQLSADARWEWFCGSTQSVAGQDERRISVIRIGAAALLAGCFSVAIRVALFMRDENVEALKTYLHLRNVSAWESFLSDQYGFLLGSDPEEAMMTFLDFAKQVHDAVPKGAPENKET
jgi:hypothetical protein